MLPILLTGCVAFLISFLIVPVIIRVADEKKMFDLPDARKLHTKPIASLGGVGIFIAFLMAAMLSIRGLAHPEFQYFFAACMLIFFLGLKDDILIISPQKKFLGQLIAAAIVIHFGHIRIDSLHGLFGINEIPLPVSIFFSYLTIVVIINAFNLIDGIDGLAGSLGVLTTGIFGIYFMKAGMNEYALLSFSMAGSLVGFLMFNKSPAKIFMGDCGSLLLGLVNSILVLKFIAVADDPHSALPVMSSVAIGFSILIVPLIDTLRVFSIRIAKGNSPFSPDRNHIHHLLLDRGLDHSSITFTCISMNIVFVAIGYYGRSLGPSILIPVMLIASYFLIGMLLYAKKPKSTRVSTKSFPQPTSEPFHAAAVTVMVSPPSMMMAASNEHPSEVAEVTTL